MAKRVVHQFFVTPGPSGEMSVGVAWAEPGWQPRVDIYETPDALILAVEVPGVPDESLRVNFMPGGTPRLVIEGQRNAPDFPGPARCHQVEIEHGPFRREVRLPREADGDAVTASRRDGLLIITVPRRQASPQNNVKVAVS
jgi:HSP20 family protein